jgi:hypothetical protein
VTGGNGGWRLCFRRAAQWWQAHTTLPSVGPKL